MITDADITKLKDVFATKDEFAGLRNDMQQGFREVGTRFEEMDDKIDSIAATLARIENTNDKYSGNIQDLKTENSMGSIHLARHDRQIEALALATNVTLPN